MSFKLDSDKTNLIQIRTELFKNYLMELSKYSEKIDISKAKEEADYYSGRLGEWYDIEKDGKIIGFFIAEPVYSSIYIHEAYIKSEYQSSGIMSSFVTDFIHTHKKVRTYFLNIYKDNQKAKNFWKKVFSTTGNNLHLISSSGGIDTYAVDILTPDR